MPADPDQPLSTSRASYCWGLLLINDAVGEGHEVIIAATSANLEAGTFLRSRKKSSLRCCFSVNLRGSEVVCISFCRSLSIADNEVRIQSWRILLGKSTLLPARSAGNTGPKLLTAALLSSPTHKPFLSVPLQPAPRRVLLLFYNRALASRGR